MLAQGENIDPNFYSSTLEVVENAIKKGVNFLSQNIGWKLSEHDLAENIRGNFSSKTLAEKTNITVAFGENSLSFTYKQTPKNASTIRRDGFLFVKVSVDDKLVVTRHFQLGENPGQKLGQSPLKLLTKASQVSTDFIAYFNDQNNGELPVSELYKRFESLAKDGGAKFDLSGGFGFFVATKGVTEFVKTSVANIKPKTILNLRVGVFGESFGVELFDTYFWGNFGEKLTLLSRQKNQIQMVSTTRKEIKSPRRSG